MEEAQAKEILVAVGVNYDKGLERFMGNTDLYRKFLGKFLYDSSFEEFNTALSAGHLEEAEKAVHTLKGTSGNLSLETLYKAADATVQAIRQNKERAEIDKLAEDVRTHYQEVCDGIRKII